MGTKLGAKRGSKRGFAKATRLAREADRQYAAAVRRGADDRAAGLHASSVVYDIAARRVLLTLTNGYLLGIPISRLPEVANEPDEVLADVELLGTLLHWESLDADYSVPALVLEALGRDVSTRELARRAGSATSEAKAAAARTNGAKGGRPRKTATHPKVPRRPAR